MTQKNGSPDWNGVDRRREERRGFFLQRGKRAVFTNLKKKLLIYFLLIVAVSVSMSLELVWEIGEAKLTDKIQENFVTEAQAQNIDGAVKDFNYELVFAPLYHLQKRMLIILAITLFCVGVALWFFIKEVAEPLDEMVHTAREISQGNLSATMPVYTKDEIGQLGSIINDITADFQEVLLMVGKINNSAVRSVDSVYNRVEVLQEKEITDDIRQELNVLYSNIGELKELVESFKFYQVDLTKV
jgi:HAMP domain-containing protein